MSGKRAPRLGERAKFPANNVCAQRGRQSKFRGREDEDSSERSDVKEDGSVSKET